MTASPTTAVTGGPSLPQQRRLLTEIPGPRFRAQGVVVLTCGTWGNVLRLLPPLSIGDALLEEGLDVLASAFADSR